MGFFDRIVKSPQNGVTSSAEPFVEKKPARSEGKIANSFTKSLMRDATLRPQGDGSVAPFGSAAVTSRNRAEENIAHQMIQVSQHDLKQALLKNPLESTGRGQNKRISFDFQVMPAFAFCFEDAGITPKMFDLVFEKIEEQGTTVAKLTKKKTISVERGNGYYQRAADEENKLLAKYDAHISFSVDYYRTPDACGHTVITAHPTQGMFSRESKEANKVFFRPAVDIVSFSQFQKMQGELAESGIPENVFNTLVKRHKLQQKLSTHISGFQSEVTSAFDGVNQSLANHDINVRFAFLADRTTLGEGQIYIGRPL